MLLLPLGNSAFASALTWRVAAFTTGRLKANQHCLHLHGPNLAATAAID